MSEAAPSFLLAIDTANERCSVAVADLPSGRVIAAREPEIGRGHAEELMGLVDEAMREAGVGWPAIAKLAVGIGPGSFTGIRVALAAAEGLTVALGIPAVGVDTLEAQAEPHRGSGPVLAAHDARRGELYVALFAAGGRRLAGPDATTPAALAGWCRDAAVSPETLRIVGSGSHLAAAALPGAAVVPGAEGGSAPIAAIARLGAARAVGSPPRPLYLRGADAKAQSPAGLRASTPAGEDLPPLKACAAS